MVQHFLEAQATQLAQAAMEKPAQVRFTLPDQVIPAGAPVGAAQAVPVPADQRDQLIGGLMDRLTRVDTRLAIRQRFTELEQSANPAMAASGRLMRHAIARHLIHSMLPSGRAVNYSAPEGEGIPSIPTGDSLQVVSAITQASDAIAEEGQVDAGRGELQVPYVPAALRFYLPQWVAFDEDDRMLVGSIAEAEAHVASMQRFLAVLHAAVGLAPYMVADEDYQAKRYGMLGQLVNQGRALARYETRDIIRTIKRRAENGELNRGLSLSLPYFDDQSLEMRMRDFEIIPAGRIMFVPAFVARAAREESAKVAQDTRLDPATRRHLVEELDLLGQAFEAPAAGSAAR
jgi:phage tail protein X